MVSADEKESAYLVDKLREHQYTSTVFGSLSEVAEHLQRCHPAAVVLDLDSVTADNHTIRSLSRLNPEVQWLSISREKFHPDLSDALRNHIYACISKPIDPDELFYWLKCITENGPENRGPPKENIHFYEQG